MENKTPTEDESEQNIQNKEERINENQNESNKSGDNEIDRQNLSQNDENVQDENENQSESVTTPSENKYVTVAIGGITVVIPSEVLHLPSDDKDSLKVQLAMQRQALIYRNQQLLTQAEHIKSQIELYQQELDSIPPINENSPNADDLAYEKSFLQQKIDEFKKNIESRDLELEKINEVIKHWSVLYKSVNKLQSDEQYKEYLKQNHSAIKIQNRYRLHFSKLVLDSLRYMKENECALKIQSTFRGYCSRKLADILNKDRKENEKRAMEIIHKFLEFVKRKIEGNKLLESMRKERDGKIEETINQRRIERRQFRAVCLIQRVFRGYLGRIKAGEKRKQRLLHGPIKTHANKYLEKGQLWNFLSCLQADYDDIQRELYEERRFATTYVNEVNKVKEENKVKVIKQWRELKKESMKKKINGDQTVSSPYLMQLTYSNVRPAELKPVKTNTSSSSSTTTIKSRRTANMKTTKSPSSTTIQKSPIKKTKRKTYVSVSKTNIDHAILMRPTTQIISPVKRRQDNDNSEWNLNDKHDTVHKLIYQAVLREYIPPFSKSYTAEDAYKEYCALLPGFQKRQWEEKAKVVAAPYIKQLYYDGVRDVEAVYYAELEKYKIPFFLLKRIKALATRVMVASEYVEKNTVSKKYNNGSNLSNSRYSQSSNDNNANNNGLLPPVDSPSRSQNSSDYNLMLKLDDKKDSRVPTTKPFGYPLSQSEPQLKSVKNDESAKMKSNEWRKRNVNKSLVPLYDEDIEILNVTIDRMNEMKELAAVKRQLLDDIKLPSGESPIDVLCMYAALEAYLDDYDNFLKILCSFSPNEILEMRQYIKAHMSLIDKNVQTIMSIMHKNGCYKVKDIIRFPLNKYFDKEFCDSIQQIIKYKLDHSYSLRKSLQSYNPKYKVGPADPLHKVPHLPPLRHKEGDIKVHNNNEDILIQSL